MFYSQFILAKKGPLGTIWIAAHLERKLRKNQVADTDIGVSVDSILFPEVPIALRLSSHLLLGVVRIYSRKVNYLFHDCSEALLKVKQAFRSTVVDLPPEESTAPYHSITLPETFDLDDFELPDSALLNGNFDDRHVSTKEQITLQDTLDGSAYSTSQFGLDERFGDGDTSQIGLDLDEELFLDKNFTVQHASVSLLSENSEHQLQDASHLTKMDIDKGPHGYDENMDNEASKDLSELLCNDHGENFIPNVENKNDEASKDLSELLCNDRGENVVPNVKSTDNETSKDLSELLCDVRAKNVVPNVEHSNTNNTPHRLIFNVQTPDLNEAFLPEDHIEDPSSVPHVSHMDFDAADPPSPEFNESVNFPTTRGLQVEALPASAHEDAAFDPRTNSQHTDIEGSNLGNPTSEEAECTNVANSGLVHAAVTSPKVTNLVQFVFSPTSVLTEAKPDAGAQQGEVLPSPDTVNDSGHVQNESMNFNLGDSVAVLSAPSPATVNDRGHVQNESMNNSGDSVAVLPAPCSISTETTPDVRASQVEELSLDKTYISTFMHAESVDPRPEDIPQVLPSSTSGLTEAASVSVVSKGFNGTTTAPGVTISDSTMSAPDTLHNRFIPNEASNQPASMYNSMMSEVSAGNISISLEDSTRLSNVDQGHVNDMNSCDKINLSSLSCDFHLKSCTSESNLPSLISSGATGITESAPAIAFGDPSRNLTTPLVGQGLNYSGFSMGGEFHSAFGTDANIVVQQKSNSVLLGSRVDVNNPLELSSNYISNVPSGHTNWFSNSTYSEPERMLFPPSINFNPPNDLGQQTAHKGVIQFDRSAGGVSSLSGHKRQYVDSSPELQNGLSTKISGMPRKRHNNDSIPNDDDLLASILVGRTPSLMVRPTPPVPKPTSLKRPRLTPKAALPKRRKVLFDDTVVLHADAIRQQLINTEDVRRMRKKAPCTRPEIWRIHKNSLEDDIFCESIFTGISEELNSLITRRYDQPQNISSEINAHNPCLNASQELEHSKTLGFVRDNNGKEKDVQSEAMLESVGVQGLPRTLQPVNTQSCLDTSAVDAQEQLESPLNPNHKEPSCPNTSTNDAQEQLESPLNLSHKEQSCPSTSIIDAQNQLESSLNPNDKETSGSMIATAEQDALGHSEVELTSRGCSNSGNDCEVPAVVRIEEKCDDRSVDPAQNLPNDMIQTCHVSNEIDNNLYIVDCSSKEFTSADQAEGVILVNADVLAAANDDAPLRAEDFSSAEHPSFSVNDMDVDVMNSAKLKLFEDGPADLDVNEIGVSMLDRSAGEVGADFPADSSAGEVGADFPADSSAGEVGADFPAGEVGADFPADSSAGEVGADFPADSSAGVECSDPSVPDVTVGSGEPTSSHCEVIKESEDGQVMADYVEVTNEEKIASEAPCGESPHIASIPFPPIAESECVPSAVVENSCINIKGGMDVENAPMEFAATRESSDLCSADDDIDTDFLNVDDEVEFDEDTNDDVADTEVPQSLENSGWSSRTRGVAKYLKNMFDEESGRGRKSVAIDNLLAGKTRKEAARMFFETLVLKTKDYINVEQENPFDSINIKPRIKLLKSEF